MTTHRKLSARILSMALSVAMVSTMLPTTVFATEGDIPIGASSVNTVGTIKSFDKLEDRFAKSTGTNAPDHVYSLSVALDTPVEDLNLPTELTAMVSRTSTAPTQDEPVKDSGKPAEDKVVEGDTTTDDTVSGNQPASPSDAEENEEIKDEDVPLAPEPEQDEETTVTTVKSENVPVTWNSDKEYKSNVNGQLIYTSVLPEGYILADGVNLPQIYVMVGRQARAASTPSPTILLDSGGNYVFGNGTALVIEKDGTGTTVYIDTNENGVKDSGENSLADEGIANAPANGADLSTWRIYGGSNTAEVTGNTLVTMNDGEINTLCAGNRFGNINGNVHLTVNGGKISGWQLITGNANGGTITGNSTIEINDGEIKVVRVGSPNNAIINGNCTVTIKGGTITGQLVNSGTINGTKTVTITGGACALNNLSGITPTNVGGEDLELYKFTLSDVTSTEIVNSITLVEDYTYNLSGVAATATLGVFLPKTSKTFTKATVSTDLATYAGSISNKAATLVKTVYTPVTGITGVPTTATVGTALTLSSTVAPTTATNKTIVWSVKTAGTTGATVSGSTLSTTAAGTVVVTATITNGLTATTPYTKDFTITVAAAPVAHVPVTGITDVPSTATAGTNLTLSGTVAPTTATNKTIVWSVKTAGTTGATISGSTLSTTAAGTVVVTATITNGKTASTNYTQDFTITVSAPRTPASIAVTTPPTKTAYTTGETFDKAGMVVTATYADSTTAAVSGYTFSPTRALATTDTTITITYTENGTTVTTTQAITVTDAPTTHTITASAGTGGSISPSGAVTVNNSENQTFTISANSNYSISSVTVDGVNQGAIGSYTFSNVTGNHTISATFSYNGGGGGSSDSGGGSTTPPTTKPTEPVTGNSNTNATVDNKGNTTVNVSDKNISDAVKAAQDAATKKGVTAGEVTAVINVTSPTNSNPNTVSVNLPKNVQEQIISNKIGNVAIVIDKPDISIGMTLATITEMNKQAKSDIQLSATRTDATKLSTEAKNAIGSRPAFDLKATYASGSKSVTNFGTGTVSIAIPYTLQKGEIAGGLYAVYVDGNGKVSYITNSSYDAEAKVLRFSTNHFSVYGISYKAPVGFTDITTHWAKTDIEFVANRGLMNGTSNTTFSPNGSMTRGMFVTALGRLAGVDVNGYKTAKFTDVKADTYYAPYVNWAAEKGIVKGTTDTTFAPDQAITRQEMATIMSSYAKALGYQVPETRAAVTFADNASIASWAAPAVKQMQMAGILNGKDGNKFDPTGTATRGEISAMLRRYVELVIDRTTTEGWTTNDSGSSLYYQSGKAVTGTKTISNVAYTFNGYGETTRKTATAGATTNPTLPADGKKYITHKIVKGDTLWDLAQKHGTTVNAIVSLNNIQNRNAVPVGTEIKILQK